MDSNNIDWPGADCEHTPAFSTRRDVDLLERSRNRTLGPWCNQTQFDTTGLRCNDVSIDGVDLAGVSRIAQTGKPGNAILGTLSRIHDVPTGRIPCDKYQA